MIDGVTGAESDGDRFPWYVSDWCWGKYDTDHDPHYCHGDACGCSCHQDPKYVN